MLTQNFPHIGQTKIKSHYQNVGREVPGTTLPQTVGSCGTPQKP